MLAYRFNALAPCVSKREEGDGRKERERGSEGEERERRREAKSMITLRGLKAWAVHGL